MRFVFQVKIKQGHTVEEYAEAWEQASAVIQKMPGARGTYLHRGISDPATLLAMAEWDSKTGEGPGDGHPTERPRPLGILSTATWHTAKSHWSASSKTPNGK